MVEILVATYNGEKYIRTQLQSLIDQSYEDIHITISDDGSTDKTVEIIDEFVKLYSDKISFVCNEENSGSACANFLKLINNAKDKEYVMLCDQDDFWEKDKVKYSLKAIKRMENKYSKSTPILVHSDLTITDENLYVLQSSMFKYQKLNSHIRSLSDELSQNSITGCTVIVNNALLQLVNPNCQNIIMHDWYLGLLATAFGHVGFIRQSFIKYRQHGNNSEGAKDFVSIKATAKKAFGKNKIVESINKTYLQAEGFKEIYYNEMSEENRNTIDNYLLLQNSSKLKKLKIARKNGFTKTGINRKIGYWLYM